MSAADSGTPARPPGYTGGGRISGLFWRLLRRLLSRRCPVCEGSGVDPDGPTARPSGRPPRCPRCFGFGRVAFP